MGALALGFILGIIASIAAAWLVEYGARPKIAISRPAEWGIGSHHPAAGAVLFFHLLVSNTRRRGALLGPRPAWGCHATLEIVGDAGEPKVGPIDARWSAHPEPVAPATLKNQSVLLLDPGKILEGRTIDVHSHRPLELCTILKFKGSDSCYLFNNESYFFPEWKNPAWELSPGAYRLRVTVHYESGKAAAEVHFRNPGSQSPTVLLEGVGESQ